MSNKFITPIFALLILICLFTPSASADWWDTSYSYRIPITITTNGTSTPINYQVLLNITHNSNMQADFDDLRFTNSNDVEIPYWIGHKIDSSYANVWVKLSEAITSTDIVYVYYGNSTVSTTEDGDDTFIQYKGITTSTYKASNIQSPPVIFEFRFTANSIGADNNIFCISESASGDNDDAAYMTIRNNGATDIRTMVANEGNTSGGYQTNTISLDSIYMIKLDGTNALFYKDNNHIVTLTSNVPTGDDMGINLWSFVSPGATIQWAFLREYITNEPLTSYGSEQYLPLNITTFTPSTPHSSQNDATQTFYIEINQIVDITWYIDTVLQQTNTSVTKANFTTTPTSANTYNVTAKANNTTNTVQQEWIWEVVSDTQNPPLLFSYFLLLSLMAVVFSGYTILYVDPDNYTHLIAGIAGSILWFILGIQSYAGIGFQHVVNDAVEVTSYQNAVLGMVFVITGLILLLYTIVKIFQEAQAVVADLEKEKENFRYDS